MKVGVWSDNNLIELCRSKANEGVLFYEINMHELEDLSVLSRDYQVILVDEAIESVDFYEICEKIRDNKNNDNPILFLVKIPESMAEDVNVLRWGLEGVIDINAVNNLTDELHRMFQFATAVNKKEQIDNWVDIIVDNDVPYIKEVHTFVEKLLKRVDMPERDVFKLEFAFKEMLQNAWEHGNQQDADKKIKISYVLFSDRLLMKISDEGSGFIINEVEDPTLDPVGAMKRRKAAGLRAGGWGIVSAKKIMDELIYSERGNEVLLVKYLTANNDSSNE